MSASACSAIQRAHDVPDDAGYPFGGIQEPSQIETGKSHPLSLVPRIGEHAASRLNQALVMQSSPARVQTGVLVRGPVSLFALRFHAEF
jgi:hypothetical protein